MTNHTELNEDSSGLLEASGIADVMAIGEIQKIMANAIEEISKITNVSRKLELDIETLLFEVKELKIGKKSIDDNKVSLDDILHVVTRIMNVTEEDMCSNSRKGKLPTARMVYAVFAAKRHSTTDAGIRIKKDHSTIIYHINQALGFINQKGSGEKDFKMLIQRISYHLYNRVEMPDKSWYRRRAA